ncbi:AtpZ/AtpI family protein [Gimesia maris]|uniref:AtpZ/AtpI family protein n=1 Tax=Gimesia maris TaxID=122 RepID=UPI00241CC1D2|nr:AtpZ/AtpI family protein [Gimesia maris]|tara:strand:- start:3218 stop:3583 length:366 start_codon:yes stop_codon:yes gene_type:complete
MMSDKQPERENDHSFANHDFPEGPLHLHEQAQIEQRIASQEARKLKAQREKHHTIWFGFGMFGLIGWSVTIPAVLGAILGMWIDARWPGPYSWTLMLMIGGVALGCLNAWKWIHKEGNIEK